MKRIPLVKERNLLTGEPITGQYRAAFEDGDLALLLSGKAVLVIEPSDAVVRVTDGREKDPVKQ